MSDRGLEDMVIDMRQDQRTGEWVVIAPGRRDRPGAGPEETGTTALPRYDPRCPFCPGNEARLPCIAAEWRETEDPGWLLRAVPNLHPIVGAAPDAGPDGKDPPAHEVLVEGARHDLDIPDFGVPWLARLLSAYLDRFRHFAGREGAGAVILFRNRGPRAGASLRHPHAQILSLPHAPPRHAAIEERALAHHGRTGRCLACDLVQAELKEGVRIVADGEAFVTLVPAAAAGPLHQLILPRRHVPSFADTRPEELAPLATALTNAVLRLRALAAASAYNLVVESALPDAAGVRHRHWCLRVEPRLTVPGGFEQATGLAVNPSVPERDAERLRAALETRG